MADSKQGTDLRSIVSKQSPVYIVSGLIALALFIFSTLLALSGNVSGFEREVLEYINGLDDAVSPLFPFFSELGSVTAVIMLSLVLLLIRRWRLSLEVLLAGALAVVSSQLTKILVERGRPADILNDVNLRTLESVGFGFPSTHTAIAFAVAMTLSAFLSKRIKWLVWGVAILVGFSRMYIGVHLPLDIVGGIALGIFIGSAIRFLLGSPNYSRSIEHVKAALESAGIEVKELKRPNVDARGSAPYFITTNKGEKYFAKIITSENRMADLIFKAWRSLVFRDFEDETPYYSAKQALEHEAYVTMLAGSKGVNVPHIRYVIALNKDFAILVMDQLDGGSLDSVAKSKVTDKLMIQTLKQVNTLHQAQIAHRDLRLANVFVQKNNKPMLIDFSFGESYASKIRIEMDVVEVIASFSIVVGAKRAVKAALAAFPKQRVVDAAAYLQLDALAGSTTEAIKKKPELLNQIREQIHVQSGSDLPPVISLTRLKLSLGWISIIVLGLLIWWMVIG